MFRSVIRLAQSVCGSPGITRHDVFGFSLDFSPAFLLYSKKKWLEMLDGFQIRRENETKFFFYVGGIDFESYFVPLTEETFRYLKKRGFTDRKVALIRDSKMKHHVIQEYAII